MVGRIFPTVRPKLQRDSIAVLMPESSKFSILSDYQIDVFARAILGDHKDMMNGFLLDSSWRVLHPYMTRIVMVRIGNATIW
jgi:hypothetical protein